MANRNLYYTTPAGLLVRPDDQRNVYPNPTAAKIANRNNVYQQMFHYYSNSAFEEVAVWARYRLRHNLYRHTRQIFNPVTRVVDFYAEHIYPGVLTAESRIETGAPSAITFDHTTPKELRDAIAQVWSWSNWQTNNTIMVQHGAMTGNVLVEVIDDVDAGKIRYQVQFPSNVKNFQLDDYGNLKAYVLEYETSDMSIDGGRTFRYGKEVQSDFIAYYKNGMPHDYGRGQVVANPYGFVPAVWVKHLDVGADFGVPAIRSAMAKIDELNSIISHTADHIHKQIESPRILWTDSNIQPLFGKNDAEMADFDTRQNQVLLRGKKDGKTDTLVGTLDPQTIIPLVEKILEEIEKDYPEITMYEKLREQNIVTAPGAARLMGDVERKVARPAANYDHANVKLAQMGTAIGGWRLENGDWGSNLTPQQEKFRGFNLTSYNKGELDFLILPRTLTSPTSREEADEFQVRAAAVASAGDALPLEEKLKRLGYRADEIPSIVAKVQKEQADKQKQAMDVMKAKAASTPPPAPGQPQHQQGVGDTSNAN